MLYSFELARVLHGADNVTAHGVSLPEHVVAKLKHTQIRNLAGEAMSAPVIGLICLYLFEMAEGPLWQ